MGAHTSCAVDDDDTAASSRADFLGVIHNADLCVPDRQAVLGGPCRNGTKTSYRTGNAAYNGGIRAGMMDA